MTTNPAPAKKPGPAATGKSKMKAKKPKKPMSRFMVALVCVLVFLVVLAGAGYCLYTDLGGAAEKAMVLLPQYRKSLAAADKQLKDLTTQKAALDAQKEKLDQTAQDNAKTADSLKQQAAQLKADQEAFTGQKADAQTAKQRQQAELDIYENLDADAAATMLLKASNLQDAADILSKLSTEKATEILTSIQKTDAKKAYDLTKLIGQ